MDFPGHFDQIFQQLNSQRLHGQLCDCVVAVCGRRFQAHRAVLAACSMHFRALFSAARGEGGASAIRLDGEVVTAEAFSALLDMMYTSTLTLGESNVMDVLLAASHLHLNAVVKACKLYLTTRTLPDPCAPHYLPARRQGPPPGPGPRLQGSFPGPGGADDSSAEGREGPPTAEQRASFPVRRFHKRKAASSCSSSSSASSWPLTPEGRQRQRAGGGPEAEPEKGADSRERGGGPAQEDAQVPSQSDGGWDGEGGPGKEEPCDGPVVKVKEGAPEEEEEEEEEAAGGVRVVVKAEPLSSPEAGDGDKTEPSPESSTADRKQAVPRAQDDGLPNTTTSEFLQGPESASVALRPGSLPGPFADALFLRPGCQRLAPDVQRTGLGPHSPARSSRGGGGASLGFPGYRRIAPKMPPGGRGVPTSSGHEGAAPAPPQLTRASADVLSKCKKAQSEHNVLVVEGARKYACRICCKTFLTLTDCKKHIRVHTGEKPYACLKCGKRFSQSSHLYKHSKTTCLRWQNLQSALL